LRAFEVRATDYLLKPVSLARLVAALRRVAPARSVESAAAPAPGKREVLSISERGRVSLVPVAEVVYFRAEQKYVTVRTRDREYVSEESLATLEAQWGAGFVRIHRSILVARAHIQGFQRVKPRSGGDQDPGDGHWEVMLRGLPERLPVSRRQWPMVKSLTGLGV
jgi:two-component system response regulator AlgR